LPRAAEPVRPMLVLGSLLFFLSGFTALLYQVVWQRLLGLFSGADVYAATIIVGAFMAGLGCGSLAGGALADRLPPHRALYWFAAAELAVGIFGFFSAPLYYDILYLRFGHLAAYGAALPVVLFLSLLWPTLFMGMSLPLLARALTRSIEVAAPTIGALYGLNALGASAGALLTTWWLLPALGLAGSLRISAAGNIVVAAVSALLASSLGRTASVPLRPIGSPEMVVTTAVHENVPYLAWLAIYGVSGFLALSLEIVWFRAISVIAKATAFTFGTLLAIYLGGLGLGAFAGSLLIGRVRRPAVLFLLIQAAVGIYAGLAVVVLLGQLDLPALTWLRNHLAQYDPLDVTRAVVEGRRELLWLYLGIPSLLIGPPTLLMGVSFPLLQKVAQTDFRRLGSRIGALMLANVIGSALGAILTGWLGLRVLGTAGSLRAIVAASAAYAVFALALSLRSLKRQPAWASTAVIATVTAVAVVAAMPQARALWAGLHGVAVNRVVFGEDETGLSLIKLPGGTFGGRSQVFVNGVGQSWMPYGEIHTLLGALPAFVHPNPKEVAIIGLGSGDTLFGLAGRREIERVVCIEIIRSQLDTLRNFDRVYGYAGLKRLLADPRIEHVTGDGRLYAMHVGREFDIIEADALRPGSAYSGNLYSDRYFTLLRDRLKPDGLAVTWAPTPRIQRTFLKVFPHAVAFRDILIGSRSPIQIDFAAIRSRIADPQTIRYYSEAAIDIQRLFEPYLSETPQVFDARLDRSAIVDINTDLFPRDEFAVPPLSKWRTERRADVNE
jgi:spermidine synthase